MNHIKELIKAIKLYYPSDHQSDREISIENLRSLTTEGQKLQGKWDNLLINLSDSIKDLEVRDETVLLMEPSFRASLGWNECHILLQLSVMVPYCNIDILKLNPVMSAQLDAVITIVSQLVQKHCPQVTFINSKEATTKIHNVRIPDIYNDEHIPTIAECIFGIRSFKYLR